MSINLMQNVFIMFLKEVPQLLASITCRGMLVKHGTGMTPNIIAHAGAHVAAGVAATTPGSQGVTYLFSLQVPIPWPIETQPLRCARPRWPDGRYCYQYRCPWGDFLFTCCRRRSQDVLAAGIASTNVSSTPAASHGQRLYLGPHCEAVHSYKWYTINVDVHRAATTTCWIIAILLTQGTACNNSNITDVLAQIITTV